MPVPVLVATRVILRAVGVDEGVAPSERASIPRGGLGARDETSLNASADFCDLEMRGPSVDYN